MRLYIVAIPENQLLLKIGPGFEKYISIASLVWMN